MEWNLYSTYVKTYLSHLGNVRTKTRTLWIVVDFDCYQGCNNPEFNPGCDKSSIRIKIDTEASEKFGLFQKYMSIPCPRCGKVGEQKRSGWWGPAKGSANLEDYDKSTFRPDDIMDYTDQMMEAMVEELKSLKKRRESELDELASKIRLCKADVQDRERRPRPRKE